MIKNSGADSIISLNIHSKDLIMYSDIPIISIDLETILINAIQEELFDWASSVIVAPDAGGSDRCMKIIQNGFFHGVFIHKGNI